MLSCRWKKSDIILNGELDRAITGIVLSKVAIETTMIIMGSILAGLALLSPLIPHFFEFFNSSQEKVSSFFEEHYGLTNDISVKTTID